MEIITHKKKDAKKPSGTSEAIVKFMLFFSLFHVVFLSDVIAICTLSVNSTVICAVKEKNHVNFTFTIIHFLRHISLCFINDHNKFIRN